MYVNKKTIFDIFTNTWSAIKRSKIIEDKRLGIDFTKPPPYANKGHQSSLKSNYYH